MTGLLELLEGPVT